ncbi:MAG: hypothetical protein WC824_05720, partial [Bacteroidota bacterium]
QKWLDEIQADGGTELASALGEAVEVLGAPGKDIFLMTDGEVGETGPIIEQCAACGTRIHILGIGAAAQDRFISTLSRRTGGVDKMVGVSEDVASVSLGLFNSIRQPLQTDVKALVVMGKMAPQEFIIGTVWEGKSIILTDKGASGDDFPVQVGMIWGIGKNSVIDLTNKKPTPNGLSALLWAGRQVEDLESALDMTKVGPARKTVEMELKEISTTYGLASRVMSLCAVVKRPGDVAGEVTQQIVPVGTPEGMTMFNGQGQTAPGAMCYMLSASTSHNHGPWKSCTRRVAGQIHSLSGTSIPQTTWGGGQSVTSRGISLNSCYSASSDVSHLTGDSVMSFDSEEASYTNDCVNIPKKSQSLPPSAPRKCSKPVDTFDLFMELGKLEADGGVPGKTPEERFFRTVFLALACLKAEVESRKKGNVVFAQHLHKMASFIESSPESKKPLIQNLIEALKCVILYPEIQGDWQKEYLSYKGDSETAWKLLEKVIP